MIMANVDDLPKVSLLQEVIFEDSIFRVHRRIQELTEQRRCWYKVEFCRSCCCISGCGLFDFLPASLRRANKITLRYSVLIVMV